MVSEVVSEMVIASHIMTLLEKQRFLAVCQKILRLRRRKWLLVVLDVTSLSQKLKCVITVCKDQEPLWGILRKLKWESQNVSTFERETIYADLVKTGWLKEKLVRIIAWDVSCMQRKAILLVTGSLTKNPAKSKEDYVYRFKSNGIHRRKQKSPEQRLPDSNGSRYTSNC